MQTTKKPMRKSLMKIYSRDFQTPTNYVVETLTYFCLMLRKGVCLNEYMDGWERFNETWLSEENNLQQPDNGVHHRRWLQTC